MKDICKHFQEGRCKYGQRCHKLHISITSLLDPPQWIYTNVSDANLLLHSISPDEIRYSLKYNDIRRLLDDMWIHNYTMMYKYLNKLCRLGKVMSTSERVVDLRKNPECFNLPFDLAYVEEKIMRLREEDPICDENELLKGEEESIVEDIDIENVPSFVKEYACKVNKEDMSALRPDEYINRPEGYNSRHAGHTSRQVGYNNRFNEYNSRPSEYNNRPSEYNSRPSEYNNRPSEYNNRPSEYNNRPNNHSYRQEYTRREGNYNKQEQSYNRPEKQGMYSYKQEQSFSRPVNYNRQEQAYSRPVNYSDRQNYSNRQESYSTRSYNKPNTGSYRSDPYNKPSYYQKDNYRQNDSRVSWSNKQDTSQAHESDYRKSKNHSKRDEQEGDDFEHKNIPYEYNKEY